MCDIVTNTEAKLRSVPTEREGGKGEKTTTNFTITICNAIDRLC